ncbi:hypothetical protein L3X38_009490 [Prunus dulcis]|uniref:CCHC-type domain-containing protein n=1 Tax=Prunus dulcis TaxID=3755 RepID=A0AAD4WDM4_PRUDU|nr:hypothetical protein L3X38_009490 [Prunus dulcis]
MSQKANKPSITNTHLAYYIPTTWNPSTRSDTRRDSTPSLPPPDNRPPLLPTPPYHPPFQFQETCQLCNRQGHTSRICPERGNFAYMAESNITTAPTSSELTNWCVDLGVTHHMTSNPSELSHVQPYTGNDSIVVGNGSHLSISHIGKTHLDRSIGSLHLNDVLCVPTIRNNLLSIRRFSKDNHCYFEMDANGFCVKDNKTGKVLLTGSSSGGLYHIHADPTISAKLGFYGERTTQEVWHARLGHPSQAVFRVLFNKHKLPFHGRFDSTKACHQDQLFLSWINGSLSSTVLATVARFTSARSTWVALENHFASPNQNRILQLCSELFRTAHGDSFVADYLDKVNAIVDNLALSGSPLPDSDLLAALLLSAEQRHLALHAPARDGPATAMVAAHGRAPSRGRSRGSGHFSFRGGHSGGSGSWSGSSSATRPPGFRGSSSSHGSGRDFSSCPGGSSSQPGVLGPHPAAAAGLSSPFAPFSGSRRVPTQRLTAMTAQQSSSPRPPNWVVDTGTNSHITNDLSNLSLFREYHGHDSVDGVLGGTG